jgi:hypothetical protein
VLVLTSLGASLLADATSLAVFGCEHPNLPLGPLADLNPEPLPDLGLSYTEGPQTPTQALGCGLNLGLGLLGGWWVGSNVGIGLRAMAHLV